MPPPHLDLKTGVIEIGILISTFLFGITTVQTYIYYRGNTRDPWWLKTLVAIVWLLETINTVLICAYLYTITVTKFGNFEALQDMPWTLDVSFFIGGLVSAFVQSFFAYRVHVISGRWAVSILAWVLSITRAAVTLLICVLTIEEGHITNYEARYPWTITLSLVVAMSIDVLNTCALCYYLRQLRTQFKGTNSLIDKIMTYSIETGLITSVCAVAMLILELSRPDWNIWLGILMFYVKLYSNSLLLSLNGRSSLRSTEPFTSFTSVSHLAATQNQTVISVSRTREVAVEMGGVKHRDVSSGRVSSEVDLGRPDSQKDFSDFESYPPRPS